MCPSRRNDRSRPLTPRGSSRREAERLEPKNSDEQRRFGSSSNKDKSSTTTGFTGSVKKNVRQSIAGKSTKTSQSSAQRASMGTSQQGKSGARSAGKTARATDRRSTPASSKPGREGTSRGPHSRQRRRSYQDVTRSRKPKKGRVLTFGGLVISLRAITLVVVSVFLIVLLAPPIFQWWRQEQSYQGVRSQLQQAQERNAKMSDEIARWKDPEYIASQARSRLGLMKPGETQYSVNDPQEARTPEETNTSHAHRGPRLPWIKTLALTIGESDAPQSKRVAGSPEPIMTGVTPQSGHSNKQDRNQSRPQSLK